MIKVLRSITFISQIIFFSCSFAGGFDFSGGGHGVERNGKIYLLDLIEAGVEKQFDQSEVAKPLKNSNLSMMLRFPEWVADETRVVFIKHLWNIGQFDPILMASIIAIFNYCDWDLSESIAGQIPIHDSNVLDLKLIAFRHGNNIRVSNSIWGKMDPRNQAALLFHEVILASANEYNESQRDLRKLVALIFSKNGRLSLEMKKNYNKLIQPLSAQNSIFKFVKKPNSFFVWYFHQDPYRDFNKIWVTSLNSNSDVFLVLEFNNYRTQELICTRKINPYGSTDRFVSNCIGFQVFPWDSGSWEIRYPLVRLETKGAFTPPEFESFVQKNIPLNQNPAFHRYHF